MKRIEETGVSFPITSALINLFKNKAESSTGLSAR